MCSSWQEFMDVDHRSEFNTSGNLPALRLSLVSGSGHFAGKNIVAVCVLVMRGQENSQTVNTL